jgi:hypothetical protein
MKLNSLLKASMASLLTFRGGEIKIKVLLYYLGSLFSGIGSGFTYFSV